MRGRDALVFVFGIVLLSGSLLAQGRGAPPAPPAGGRGAAPAGGRAAAPPPPTPTPRTQAPFDPTGYWVAIISEDWRWRMITPAKGDFPSIPINLEAQKIAESWDPAKDEAAGEQCRASGAPGLIRGPIRMHITWLDDTTLKIETDYGMQTRLLKFGNTPGGTPNSWQGVTTAQWQIAGGGRGRGAQRYGTLKTVTSQLKPGYLRKNGVPYSNKTVLTEYWDLLTEANGDKYLLDTNIVEDPVYLQLPFTTAIHYKQEKDGSKYDPTPCDARF
jgi:hypothetical protein